jgi:hypothetical protein
MKSGALHALLMAVMTTLLLVSLAPVTVAEVDKQSALGVQQDYGVYGKRTLYPETSLQQVTIITPQQYLESAQWLAASLEELVPDTQVVVEVVEHLDSSWYPFHDAMWERNLILLGNMETNKYVTVLYGMSLTAVDAYFPFAGGYVLQTIVDPLGKGKNVLLVGASDADGMQAGLKKLVAAIDTEQGVVPWTAAADLKMSSMVAPVSTWNDAVWTVRSMVNQLAVPNQPPSREMATLIEDVLKMVGSLGEAYAYTGESKYGEGFTTLLHALLDFVDNNKQAVALVSRLVPLKGFGGYLHTALRLVEPSPLLDENDRRNLVTLYAQTLDWDMQMSYITQFIDLYKKPNPPVTRRNKYIFTGLNIALGAQYFTTFLPEYHAAVRWKSLADDMFEKAESLISQDDSTDYLFYIPMTFLRYGAAFGREDIIREAIAMADLQLMFIDNLGGYTTLGDGQAWGNTSALYWGHSVILRAAAFFMGDPQYIGVIDKVNKNKMGFNTSDLIKPMYMYNSSIKGVLPNTEPQVTAYPIDAAYYGDMHNPNSPIYSSGIAVAADKAFFKMVWRSGWGEEDQYMLLDGVSGAIHSNVDGNSILSLTDQGRIWLTGGRSLGAGTSGHTGIVVRKDGKVSNKPTLVSLEALVDLPGFAYTRTRDIDYGGTDADRHILWNKQRYFVVVDEITIKQSAQYSIENNWYVLGNGSLQGRNTVVLQRDRQFSVINRDTSKISVSSKASIAAKDWAKYRYFIGAPDMTYALQTYSGRYQPGDKLTFVNVLVGGGVIDAVESVSETALLITSAGLRTVIGIGELQADRLAIRAEAFMLDEQQGWSLVNATSLSMGNLQITTSNPLTLYLDAKAKTLSVPGGTGVVYINSVAYQAAPELIVELPVEVDFELPQAWLN